MKAEHAMLCRVSNGTATQSPSSAGTHVPRRQNVHPSPSFAPAVVASIDSDFTEELTKAGFGVVKLAHARGLSVRQFERKCRERLDACPREMIQEIRMALARERLLSDAPLKQIAADLGYKHAADFSRAFRHHYHMSPAQMRRKLLKKSHRPLRMSHLAKRMSHNAM